MSSGSDTLDKIAAALVTAGIGALSNPTSAAWQIYFGFLEDGTPAPDQAICLNETPGTDPDPAWSITYPSVQVVVRGGVDEYPEMKQKQQEIFNILHGANSLLSSNFVYFYARQSAPISMGRDEKRRPKSAWNYRSMRNTPT